MKDFWWFTKNSWKIFSALNGRWAFVKGFYGAWREFKKSPTLESGGDDA